MSIESSNTIINNTSNNGNSTSSYNVQKQIKWKENIEKSINITDEFRKLKEVENFKNYNKVKKNKEDPLQKNIFKSVESLSYSHSSLIPKSRTIFDDNDLIISKRSNKKHSNSSKSIGDAKILENIGNIEFTNKIKFSDSYEKSLISLEDTKLKYNIKIDRKDNNVCDNNVYIKYDDNVNYDNVNINSEIPGQNEDKNNKIKNKEIKNNIKDNSIHKTNKYDKNTKHNENKNIISDYRNNIEKKEDISIIKIRRDNNNNTKVRQDNSNKTIQLNKNKNERDNHINNNSKNNIIDNNIYINLNNNSNNIGDFSKSIKRGYETNFKQNKNVIIEYNKKKIKEKIIEQIINKDIILNQNIENESNKIDKRINNKNIEKGRNNNEIYEHKIKRQKILKY